METNTKTEDAVKDVEKYSMMYQKSLEDAEEIKNRIDNIQNKLDNNNEEKRSNNEKKKYEELEDIVLENTILIKK